MSSLLWENVNLGLLTSSSLSVDGNAVEVLDWGWLDKDNLSGGCLTAVNLDLMLECLLVFSASALAVDERVAEISSYVS